MKRIVAVSLLLVMMCGCAANEPADVQKRTDSAIREQLNRTVQKADHHKKYYSYYLPSDMGRYESTQLGNVLSCGDVRILMSLNVSGIINEKLYADASSTGFSLSDREKIAYSGGHYNDYDGTVHAYELAVYDLSFSCTVCFRSDTVLMIANCPSLSASSVAGRMIELARSVSVETDTLVADYSNRIPEVKNSEKVELFESMAPENGRIEELFEDHTTVDPEQYEGRQFDSDENSSDSSHE